MGRFELTSEEITSGAIPRVLLVLAVPIFAQNVVLIVQQVVDLFWLGRYSNGAVAAVGLVSPVVDFLVSSAIAATSVGTQVLVSQRVGADDQRGARRSAFSGLVLAVALSLVLGVVMYLNADVLLDLFERLQPGDGRGRVPALAVSYLRVIALGLVFAGMSDAIGAAFLGRGESRAIFYMTVVAVVVNVGLDPVLIFGLGPIPELGVQGAALATVAGYAAGFVLGGMLVARGWGGGVYSRTTARLDVGEFRELLDVGVPAGVQGAAGTLGFIAMTAIVFAVAGPAGLVAHTVGTRLVRVSSRSIKSLHQAAQNIVGQNFGAGKPQRAMATTRVGAGVGVGVLGLVGLCQLVFAEPITHLFVPDAGGRAFALSVIYLRILALGNPAMAVISLVKAGFNGVGRTRTSMVASLVETWVLKVPGTFVAGVVLGFGAVGVFWAQTVAVVAVAVGLGSYYVSTTGEGMYEQASDRVDATSDV